MPRNALTEPPAKRTKRTAATLNPSRIFNTDSPITKAGADIQTFLSICFLNWERYTEEEKVVIISILPPGYRKYHQDSEGRLLCPVSPEFIASDRTIRDQIAKFKRDVTDGYYTKTWQEKAQKAMEERANGKYDDYLAIHAAESFVDENITEQFEDDGVGTSDGDSKQEIRSKTLSHNSTKQNEIRKSARKTNMLRAPSKLADVLDLDSEYDEV